MTFFRWDAEDGNLVSSYIWIYFLIAAIFTAITLYLWWYFLVFRPSKGRPNASGTLHETFRHGVSKLLFWDRARSKKPEHEDGGEMGEV